MVKMKNKFQFNLTIIKNISYCISMSTSTYGWKDSINVINIPACDFLVDTFPILMISPQTEFTLSVDL